MNELLVFEFVSYKAYLKKLTGKSGQRRGVKTKIAAALRCQPTYISQIIHRSAHLSLEQAEKLSQFLAHTPEEMRYFLLLVQRERAGTKSLETFFQKQLHELLEQRLILTKRLNLQTTLSTEQQATYYSSWHYTAVHFALTLPDLSTKEKIANYLNLSQRKVSEVLDFLMLSGLCTLQNGKLTTERKYLALALGSPLLSRHHTNWRQQAIASLDWENAKDDLHYSAVFTVSKKDFDKLKEGVLGLLKEQRELIKASPEQDLYCYSIDLFGLRST